MAPARPRLVATVKMLWQTRPLAWLAPVWAVLPFPALAQIVEARATIIGQVLRGDSTAIVGADVVIVGSRERATTDENGRFRFTNIYPGRYELLFRGLGYEPLTRIITVGRGETSNRSYAMRALPRDLPVVNVAGKRREVLGRYEGAYRRAASQWGDFIFADDIARRNPLDTKALLDGIPGVHVRANGSLTFERCTEGKIHVWIDGQRVTQLGDSSRAMRVTEALNSVHPFNIEMIEVYRGVARIPAEFLVDACAVVAIWTKAY